MKVLIVEDDPDMSKIIRLYLEREGYQTKTARNGNKGLQRLLGEPFDLAIVDWMLPEMDGLSLCREVRRYQLPVKIIMLTAKTGLADELSGLSSGADDYIRKPFEPGVLLIRIKKLFHLEQRLILGSLALCKAEQCIYLDGTPLKLTRKEYDLLSLLIEHPGQVFSRELLLDRVWGREYEGDIRTVDTHIRRLRHKIGSGQIRTHVGLGYSAGPHQ